jgi:tetratricopeptide (TPR) repeat protein
MWVDLRELRRGIESGSSPTISDIRKKMEIPFWKRPWVWAAGAVVVLAVAAYLLFGGFGLSGLKGEPSVAVLWFENRAGTEEDEYFVEGMTDELITELWKIGGLRVSTLEDIRPFKDSGTAPTEIGQQLDFDYILTGTIKRSGDRIRVTPRLIEASSGSLAWTERFEDISDNLFTLQDEIALKIARKLRVQLSPEEEKDVAAVPTDSREAHDHYLKGRHYYHQETMGDNELAIKEYKKALQLDPDYALAMAGLAEAYVQKYKERYDKDELWLDEAKQLIDRALKIESDSAEAFKSLAEVHLEERSYSAALEAAERAQQLQPDWDEPYLCLGRVYDNRGESKKALEMFERALAIRRSVEGLCGKGQMLQRRGDIAEAEKAYEEALALNPDSFHPYVQLAYLYEIGHNEMAEAEQYLRKAIEVRPDWGGTYLLLADLLDEVGRLQEGEQLLRDFLDSHPYNWEAYQKLYEYIAWWKGDYQEAMEVAKEAAVRNPDRAWPHLLLASSYAIGMERDPQPEQAIASLERALQLRPDSYSVQLYVAQVYETLQRDDEALAYFERALELNPGSAEILNALGHHYLENGDFLRAKDYFQQAIRNAPGQASRYVYGLQRAMVSLGEFEEYHRIFEKAAELYGEYDAEFLVRLGEAHRQAGEYDKSISTFSLVPTTYEPEWVQYNLAVTLWLSGDAKTALAKLRQLRNHWQAPLAIFAILKSEGRYDEADEWLAGLKEPDPERTSGLDYWATMAERYYLSMRRWDDAIAAIDEAEERGELTWVEWADLIRAYFYQMKGDIPKARALLEHCIATCHADSRIDIHAALAWLEAAMGNPAAALDQVEQAAAVYRWEDDHMVIAASLLYATGRKQEALERLQDFRGGFYVWSYAHYEYCQLKSVLDPSENSKACYELAAKRSTFWARSAALYRMRWTSHRAPSLAQAGDEAGAREALQWLLAHEPERADAAYIAAITYSVLGDTDEALRWLRTAVDRGYQDLWWARVDPDLDPLRDDPRFKKIMADWDTQLTALFKTEGQAQ